MRNPRTCVVTTLVEVVYSLCTHPMFLMLMANMMRLERCSSRSEFSDKSLRGLIVLRLIYKCATSLLNRFLRMRATNVHSIQRNTFSLASTHFGDQTANH